MNYFVGSLFLLLSVISSVFAAYVFDSCGTLHVTLHPATTILSLTWLIVATVLSGYGAFISVFFADSFDYGDEEVQGGPVGFQYCSTEETL